MMFATHPRRIQHYRDVKPACAGTVNFRCKTCKNQIYVIAGRKKAIGGGWNYAGCAK